MAKQIKAEKFYLERLEEFLTQERRQSDEGRYFQVLRLLAEAFEEEQYIHLPVKNERATRKPLDDVFQFLQDRYTTLESAMEALITDLNGLESSLSLEMDEIASLILALETEITSRRLRSESETEYKELEENFPGFGLTLDSSNSTNQTQNIDTLEWLPQQQGVGVWFGNISTHPTAPVVQTLDEIKDGEAVNIQHIFLTQIGEENEDLGQVIVNHIRGEIPDFPDGDFSEINITTSNTFTSLLPSIEGTLIAKFAMPVQISTISFPTSPANIVAEVRVVDYQGITQSYAMNDGTLFIPPTLTSEIRIKLAPDSAPSKMPAWFQGHIIFSGDEMYAQFHDVTGDLLI